MYQPASTEPQWLDLFEGVRAQFAPISRAAARAASRVAQAALADVPDDEPAAGDAFSAELIRRGLRGWEGIADRSGKKPLPFSPEAVETFIADPTLFAAADAAYVLPFLDRRAEKNGSAPSPAGTSAGAIPARRTAATAQRPVKTALTKSPRRAR